MPPPHGGTVNLMSSISALASDLAARSDDQLRALLKARPDLGLPPVPDFAALAARASTRISVQRALENLTRPQLTVLEAAVLTTNEDTGHSTSAAGLKQHLGGATAKTLDAVLSGLHALALLIRAAPPPEEQSPAASRRKHYLPVGTIKDALGPYPAGLGRPFSALAASHPVFGGHAVGIVAQLRAAGYPLAPADTPAAAAAALGSWVADRGNWEQLMSQAPPATGELLARFRTAAVGAVPDALRRSSVAETSGADAAPVDWLLARGLLAPLDAGHVELPREAGIAARSHLIAEELQLEPPRPALRTTRNTVRDNAAYAAVADTLRLLTEVLSLAAAQPVTTLRSGGVGVREVRRLADGLRIEQQLASWLLELAAGAGLLVLDVDTSRWVVPSAGLDWTMLDRHLQWLEVVRSWYESDRAPALVGEALSTGGAINVLAAEAHRPEAPMVRHRLLLAMAHLAAEQLPDGNDGGSSPAPSAADVVGRLSWHQPRLQRRFSRLVPGMLAEAAHLGLIGSGALTALGELAAAARFEEAAAVLADKLPPPLSHFMLQADLTAVAPGYLEPAVARELALLSTAEGQGPAAIHRFSAQSLRRALDAGQDAAAILDFLTRHSATEVPQPLRYLVEDTAARHGRLRVGPASSYLRSDDDAALGTLLADPRTAALGLVKVAPTVVVSRAGAAELLETLRELGYAPARDPAAGSTGPAGAALGAAGSQGAAGAFPRPAVSGPRATSWSLSDDDIAAQLAALRASAAARKEPGRAGRQPAGGVAAGGVAASESGPLIGLETLRKAIRLKSRVRMGIVDQQGNHRQEILVPLSVAGGRVRVYDAGKDVERVVSIHRVMDVELVED